jgi:hypothetical protein
MASSTSVSIASQESAAKVGKIPVGAVFGQQPYAVPGAFQVLFLPSRHSIDFTMCLSPAPISKIIPAALSQPHFIRAPFIPLVQVFGKTIQHGYSPHIIMV